MFKVAKEESSELKVMVVLMTGNDLLDQTEVVDELPLSLSQLVDHLFKSSNSSTTPHMDANTTFHASRSARTALTDDCSTKEVELVPAHILFRNLGVDLFPRTKDKGRVTQTRGPRDDRLTQKHSAEFS